MDAREILENERMTVSQWLVVAMMVLLLALDGFDVLSISFASPGIAADWGIDRAALGVVLSMELIGMSIGSIALGRLADRMGRRGTILVCLVIMTAGMFAASTATGIVSLSLWRVLTGLGLGGMLAATNAATAEVANGKFRALCLVLMAGGYPLGNVIGGSVAVSLLQSYDWRAIFIFGSLVALACIPLVWFFVPESISFTAHRGGPGALEKVNRILARLGHRGLDALPAVEAGEKEQPAGMKALLGAGLARSTILLTVVYFAHIMTFYFILKWIPKIVNDMGYEPSAAGGVLVYASIGGLSGSLLLGLLTLKVRVFWLTLVALVASAIMVVVFGQSSSDLHQLSIIAGMTGFVTNAGVVGIYAIVANAFPTSLRASATGIVIGVGRGGSALAPALAGVLFAAGYMLDSVALLMALGSVLAAAALLGSGLYRNKA